MGEWESGRVKHEEQHTVGEQVVYLGSESVDAIFQCFQELEIFGGIDHASGGS